MDLIRISNNLTFRAEFNQNIPTEIKFLTQNDIPAYFITVDVDGKTVSYGNDRTKVYP